MLIKVFRANKMLIEKIKNVNKGTIATRDSLYMRITTRLKSSVGILPDKLPPKHS